METDAAIMHKSWPLAAQIGRTWFKWRSFSPVPLFMMLFLLPSEFTLHGPQYALLIAAILLSESLRLWAVGHAGSTTRTRGETVQQLVHAGPYRFVRNPLYIANITMYTCCGIIFGFGLLSLFIFVYSSVEYYFIVSFEEQILSRTFGQQYVKYTEQVPRWFPSLKPSCESSGHSFNLKAAFKSEKSTFYSMLAMLVGFFVKFYVLN